MVSGIYMIQNVKTNQKYIGQSINIEKRLKDHLKKLKNNNHENDFLQKSFNKYQEKNFKVFILTTFDNKTSFLKEVLNDSEKFFIRAYNTYKNKRDYNLTPGGDFNPMMSLESRKKLSKVHSGKNNPMYGKHHTEETRKKMSQSRSGKKHHMFGKHHTKKSKEKISKTKSKKQNSVGYYRVYKAKSKTCTNGFYYRYRYYDNNKRRYISSVSISELEKKVKKEGLPWYKI